MKKKGDSKMIMPLIGGILFVVFLGFILYASVKLFGFYSTSTLDKVTESNWEFLLREVEKMRELDDGESKTFLLQSRDKFIFSPAHHSLHEINICDKEGCTEKVYRKKNYDYLYFSLTDTLQPNEIYIAELKKENRNRIYLNIIS